MSRHCKDCRWKNELMYQPHCRNCVAFSNWSPELDSMQSTIRKYIENDIKATYAMQHATFNSVIDSKKHSNSIPAIKDVIFNPPATIIIWEDKTKTVVKCGEGDIYDPEKGMAMAISRKALGDRGSYYNVFEKWLEKYNPPILEGKTFYTGNAGTLTGFLRLNADNVKIVNTGTGEVTNSDISEYDPEDDDKECRNCKHDYKDISEPPCNDCSDYSNFETVDKQCSNCKYNDCDGADYPCSACYGPKTTIAMCNKWEPKESDD